MKKTCSIPPNKGICIFCIVAMLILRYLGYLGFEGNPPNSHNPWYLFWFCFISLVLEVKTTYFSSNGLMIKYHLLGWKRRIPFEKIRSIEYVCYHNSHYFLVATSECPLLRESKLNFPDYTWFYFRRVIKVWIPAKRVDELVSDYKSIFPELLL